MNEGLIDAVIETQAQLIAALDLRDVVAIERRTAQLAVLLAGVRQAGAWRASDTARQRAEHALLQCDAAKRRVNYLSHENRERMQRLAQVRGSGQTSSYAAVKPRLALVTG